VSDGRNLVLFGTHPFASAVPLGDWHLARALGRRHRVLWVDPPASRGSLRSPRPAPDGVMVGRPVVPTGRPVPPLGSVVERLVTAQVNRWTRQLGMADVDAVSFAPRLGALRGLRRHRLAAWIKDRDWAAVDVDHRAWIRDRQADQIRGADVVTAVSTPLVSDCRALGVDATLIPNGCDLDAFASAGPEPARLRAVARPRVVFAGAWNGRVDVALVEELAARLPATSIVLIGQVTTATPAGPNIHVVGPIPQDEIPAHLWAADVGIIPYRSCSFNDASCPLKMFEYLAAGLPVVASAVDVSAVGDPDLARRCDAVDGFVDAVDRLSGRDVKAACTSLAADHSWDARAVALLDVLDTATGRRSR
jgi:teichuronic acid biosynthesis glycosyltransferase TuaH